MKKRVISFALILVMMISVLPTVAFAKESGKCGEGVYWEFDKSAGILTISGAGEIDTDNAEIEWANNAPWQDYTEDIKEVYIEEGITVIGAGAFRNCTALEKVDMPDSLEDIRYEAFYNCKSLKQVTIPDNVERINSSFVNCTGLKSVTITGAVESISSAFKGCENITRVNISDVSKWCSIFFSGASANPLFCGADLYINGVLATDIVINDAGEDIQGRKVIWNNAFYNCKSLKSVTISGDIEFIGIGAFANCQNLEMVNLSDSVKIISVGAFENCQSLRKIQLPSQLTKLHSKAFRNSLLRVVYIPAGVTDIADDAFENTKIKYVYYAASEQDKPDILKDAAWLYGQTKLPEHKFNGYVCEICGDINADSSTIFSDVPTGAWYKKQVDYAFSYGIFTGTTQTTFSPAVNMTRAQFVQVLANISGVDTTDKNVETVFTDVPSGKWFTPAVKWANENGIVGGTGDSKFSPNNNITREDMCVMLVRFAAYKNLEIKATKEKTVFADDSKIGKWAVDAVYTCQMAEIVGGKGNNTFDPKATGSRSEAATIFTRFHKNYIA